MNRRISTIGLLSLCLVLGHGVALGQTASGDAAAGASRTPRQGTYKGAVPGEGPVDKRRRKDRLSWVGFQPRDGGGARLFLRLANELPYQQSVVDGALVVHLEGARFRDRNAQRRLDVHFFGTALRLITSERVSRRSARGDGAARAAGIEMRIRFKDGQTPAPATASMKTEADGYTYLYLDFAPPSGADAAP